MTKKFTRELGGKLHGYSLIAEDSTYGPLFKIIVPEHTRTFDEGVYMDSDTLDSLTRAGKQLIADLKEAKQSQEHTFKQVYPDSPVFILDVAYGIDSDGEVKVLHCDSDGSVSDYSFANAEMLLAFCSNFLRACSLLSQMIEDSKDDE